ncbi:copper/zinc superoxide dismutase 1 [Perilla frutescens var. frutescens]|nr:copper/zinc superoxide dismutase 1 [Perilla frutescens var. frutescens]
MAKAVAVLSSSEGVKGTVYFTQEGDGPTTITGNVSGLKPELHGFHVHALGDTTNGCMSTGSKCILLPATAGVPPSATPAAAGVPEFNSSAAAALHRAPDFLNPSKSHVKRSDFILFYF